MSRTTDPPVSEAQRRAMGAAMSGESNLNIPKSVGKEFIEADPGGKLPERAKDVTEPRPASGPMSTRADAEKREGLPRTVGPFPPDLGSGLGADTARDKNRDCGKAMSLDDIKAAGKRIGRY